MSTSQQRRESAASRIVRAARMGTAVDRSKSTAEQLDDGSDITAEEWDFMCAMERYKKQANIKHLTWRDVLAVAKRLGYERATPADGRSKC